MTHSAEEVDLWARIRVAEEAKAGISKIMKAMGPTFNPASDLAVIRATAQWVPEYWEFL